MISEVYIDRSICHNVFGSFSDSGSICAACFPPDRIPSVTSMSRSFTVIIVSISVPHSHQDPGMKGL